MNDTQEKINWSVESTVEKWLDSDAYQRGDAPDQVDTHEGNLLLNEGIAVLLDKLIGAGSATVFDNTNARLGVGNSSTAAAATQTALQGASQLYNAMEATFPSRTDQTLTFKAVFGETDANFAWEEWSIDNGAAGAVNLNRRVVSMGTKSSGTWTLTVTITIS